MCKPIKDCGKVAISSLLVSHMRREGLERGKETGKKNGTYGLALDSSSKERNTHKKPEALLCTLQRMAHRRGRESFGIQKKHVFLGGGQGPETSREIGAAEKNSVSNLLPTTKVLIRCGRGGPREKTYCLDKHIDTE